jgi:hypothetical protein
MLECFDELSIVAHSFIISIFLCLHLLEEEFLLNEWVIQFGVGVSQLLEVDEKFESTLEECGYLSVSPGLERWNFERGLIS